MKSFLNDPELKRAMLRELTWHAEQDAFVQGIYWSGEDDDFEGCAVGCSINSLNRLNGTDLVNDDHSVYEEYLGLPEWLAILEDKIFEMLPAQEAKKWPLQFIKAIPVGVELDKVKWQFIAYLMEENINQVLMLNMDESLKYKVISVIRKVLLVAEKAIDTGVWDEAVADDALNSVAYLWSFWSAEAAEAAEAAISSAARSAAGSITGAVSWSANSSSWSARSGWSVRSAAYTKYSKKLLKLLRAAK